MSTSAVLVPGFYERHLIFGLQTGDASAPTFTVTPFASSVQALFVTTRTTISDPSVPGTFYVAVLPDGGSAPSAAQVKAGTDAADGAVPSANIAFTTNGQTVQVVTGGLSAETAYDVYYVATDAFGNDSTPAFYNVTTNAVSTATKPRILDDLSDDVITRNVAIDL